MSARPRAGSFCSVSYERLYETCLFFGWGRLVPLSLHPLPMNKG
jgi:hypothetical protein